MTIPANPTRLLTFERPTTKTARAKRRGVTASTRRHRPLRWRRRSQSQKRSHKKGETTRPVTRLPWWWFPPRRSRSRPTRSSCSSRSSSCSSSRWRSSRRARWLSCRAAPRGAAAAAPGRRTRSAAAKKKRSGRGVDCGKASTPPAFRLGSIPSPRRRDRFGRALLPARRAGVRRPARGARRAHPTRTPRSR